MLWRPKSTISKDDEEWQLEAWAWILSNLGGIDELKRFPTKLPSRKDFPPSGKTGMDHVEFVFNQVAEIFYVDANSFELVLQDDDVNPVVGPLAVVQNVPNNPLGTYQFGSGNKHSISLNPGIIGNLEQLIATFAHEVCHPILLTFPDAPPGGDEMEEFATDLAMVVFGFGIFGGNTAFSFNQFNDHATGTQGWSVSRSGYLTQNEWGYALALRRLLIEEADDNWLKYLDSGLKGNFHKNLKYLDKNMDIVKALRAELS